MSDRKLARNQVEKLLKRLQDELGKADQKRLEQLLPLINNETLSYGEALQVLFPEQDTAKAQESFRSFRNRVNSAADEADVTLKLEADSQKRSDPNERFCWFVGEDSTVEDIERYSAEEAHLDPNTPLVPIRAMPNKPLIKIFVSYAHKNNQDRNPLVKKLMDDLQEYFKSSHKYIYETWGDWDILVGEEWDKAIQKALVDCDFGLSLISLPFLNSNYIKKHELPKLLKAGKILPVGLEQFKLSTVDLQGLEKVQIFLDQGRFYDRCDDNQAKDFIATLFEAIETKLDKLAAQGNLKKRLP